ncbi:MAG: hypothetical protein M0Z61_11055 [Nitrospiraceae bacterium]|nr:hypothetical protein [Nitrospiraceae bacterium]
MPKFPRSLFSVIVTGMAAFGLLLTPSVLLAQPKIAFEKEAVNFGKAVSGTVVEGKFIIMNKGDQPLEIEELRPG